MQTEHLSLRQIFNAHAENRPAILAAEQIMRLQFEGLGEDKIGNLPERFEHPEKAGFDTRLVVAEEGGSVIGFATLLHMKDLGFCYLDFMACAPGRTGQGIGTQLYNFARERAKATGAKALLFECRPDDRALARADEDLAQNKRRLAFYERLGARPVVGTLYETPVSAEAHIPYLVLDTLDGPFPDKAWLKDAVRASVERIYPNLCSPDYIDRVAASFTDAHVGLRPARYGACEPTG